MKTEHCFYFEDSRHMAAVASDSVALTVTSPPYPMIAMWDDLFASRNSTVAKALKKQNGPAAFESMHADLDAVWQEVFRVTRPGGIACINVGDATRSVAGDFALYSNHSRIQSRMLSLGFTALPAILWRKQTNAPNKFMGSGMLPAGAYVTLEHEYILIFRKGAKREFSSPPEKDNRRQSALFWEERNIWFSDVWTDLKGARQALDDPVVRKRSAAFPFEVPYRLISMFSVKGDTVLDPFAGVGTTAAAAVAAGRSSIGYELAADFNPAVTAAVTAAKPVGRARIRSRLEDHARFIEARYHQKGPFRYRNIPYGFPVVTRQEVDLVLNDVLSVERLSDNRFRAEYEKDPCREYGRDWQLFFSREELPTGTRRPGELRGRAQATLPGFASAPEK